MPATAPDEARTWTVPGVLVGITTLQFQRGSKGADDEHRSM